MALLRAGPASMRSTSEHPPASAVDEEPADVGVDPAPLLDRRDQGGQVVVREDEVRGLPGHLGASLAHRHPDVGRPQRRCIVHAVPGHGHDVTCPLEGAHQGVLVGGCGPRDDAALELDERSGMVVRSARFSAG